MDETKPFWPASSSVWDLWSTRPLSRLEYSKDAAQSWNDRYNTSCLFGRIRNFPCLSWKAAELSDTFMSYFFPVKSQWIHREQSELNIPKTAKTYQIYPVCFTWLNISYFISQLCYMFCFVLYLLGNKMLLKRHRFVSFSYPGVNPVENDDIVQCFLKPNIWNMSLLSLWDMVFWTKTGNDPTRQAFKAISWDKCWHLTTRRKSFYNKINSWYLWKINAVNNKTHTQACFVFKQYLLFS